MVELLLGREVTRRCRGQTGDAVPLDLTGEPELEAVVRELCADL